MEAPAPHPNKNHEASRVYSQKTSRLEGQGVSWKPFFEQVPPSRRWSHFCSISHPDPPPPPLSRVPGLVTHSTAPLGGIWLCPQRWHLAAGPTSEALYRDLPSSQPSSPLALCSPIPRESTSKRWARPGAPGWRASGRALLCQVEWEFRSYQLITFRAFPRAEWGRSAGRKNAGRGAV